IKRTKNAARAQRAQYARDYIDGVGAENTDDRPGRDAGSAQYPIYSLDAAVKLAVRHAFMAIVYRGSVDRSLSRSIEQVLNALMPQDEIPPGKPLSGRASLPAPQLATYVLP